MKPYHYGKEARLQGAQQATAAKRTVSPTGRLVRRATPETDGGHMAAIAPVRALAPCGLADDLLLENLDLSRCYRAFRRCRPV